MTANGPIRLFVGLGNPGTEYRDTRHNAGFWLVEAVAARHGGAWRRDGKFHGEVARIAVTGRECWLLKPQTYMNRSGQAVRALAQFYRIEPAQILVAHDELDLPPGAVRVKQGGGHAGHNGLRDMQANLGSADYWRLRIGIGHPGVREQVAHWVLQAPSREDAAAIQGVIEAACDAMPELLDGDMARVMNRLHGRA